MHVDSQPTTIGPVRHPHHTQIAIPITGPPSLDNLHRSIRLGLGGRNGGAFDDHESLVSTVTTTPTTVAGYGALILMHTRESVSHSPSNGNTASS